MCHCFCIAGTEIDQIKKNYVESQSRRNSKLKGLGDELHGVHKVMFDNIDAVLQRGELISGECWEIKCICSLYFKTASTIYSITV